MSKSEPERRLEWWRAERITWLGFMLMLMGVTALSALGYSCIGELETDTNQIASTYTHKTGIVQSITETVNGRISLVRSILEEDDPFRRDEMIQRYRQLALAFDRNFHQLQTLGADSAGESKVLNHMASLVANTADLRNKIVNLAVEPAGNSYLILNRSMDLNADIHKLLNQLETQQRDSFETSYQSAKLEHGKHLSLLLICFILMLVLMLSIAFWVGGYVKGSNRKLAKLAMEKSMLLATMSHEIRTPLTSIIGFGETLLAIDTTKEERISAINAVVRNGRYLQGVINNILDFSKIDAGQMEFQQENMSVATCLDDLDAMLRGRAQSKGLNFNIRAKTRLPESFETDPIKLRQILINLIGNAIKFTEKGSVLLMVGFDEAESILQFDVIDTGIGIPGGKQAALFNPYQQLTEQHFEGTGLGLYISRQMAELLGGTLSLNSEPDNGSCFSLCLPVELHQGTKLIHWQTTAGIEPSQSTIQHGVQFQGRVLLAEDRKDNQRLFSIYLEKAGVEVELASNGREAVEMAQEKAYDIILMDVQMPDMDGITATQALRQEGYLGTIIALTASQSTEDHRRCMEAGFDDFLSKPISRADFINVLGQHLEQRSDVHVKPSSPVYSSVFERDPELLPALDYFVGQLSQNQQSLERYLEEQDWEALKELVHDLKGSAGGVGYPELSKLAMQVEFALAKQDAHEVAYLAGQMQEYIQRIQIGYQKQRSNDNISRTPLDS